MNEKLMKCMLVVLLLCLFLSSQGSAQESFRDPFEPQLPRRERDQVLLIDNPGVGHVGGEREGNWANMLDGDKIEIQVRFEGPGRDSWVDRKGVIYVMLPREWSEVDADRLLLPEIQRAFSQQEKHVHIVVDKNITMFGHIVPRPESIEDYCDRLAAKVVDYVTDKKPESFRAIAAAHSRGTDTYHYLQNPDVFELIIISSPRGDKALEFLWRVDKDRVMVDIITALTDLPAWRWGQRLTSIVQMENVRIIQLQDRARGSVTHSRISNVNYQGEWKVIRDLRDEVLVQDVAMGDVIKCPRREEEDLLSSKPVKEDDAGTPVRSTETVGEDGNPVTGIEAGPVVSRMLAPALMGQVRWRLGSALNMRDVLPTVGPHGTNRVGPLPVNQVLTEGNAVEAAAYEFREGRHFTSTKAVALVMKTHPEVYKHDYPICPRFHLNSLDNLAAVPLSLTGSGDEEAWFWFSSIFDNRSENVEVGCHFAVFVNEANRELTVDSRWIDKQYSPYWRSPRAKPYDYILNFQVWSYNAEETIKLVRSVLQRFPEGWNVRYANREEPTQPTGFVEEAWLSGNAVHLSVWNRSWLPLMTCFHGTTDVEENPFEEWMTVYPGRNTVRLSLGASFDATIHCEVNGFIDKVYVSRKRTQRSARPMESQLFGRPSVSEAAERPSIHIVWPPADARVVTLDNQLDMPRDDNGKRLAINGICPGAPVGSRVAVQVYTDQWYPHKGRQPEIKEGAWGVRAYLSGEGQYNKHWIHAALYDRHGKKLAEDMVGPIYRVAPLPERAEGRRVAPDPLAEPRQEFKPITIDAGKFRVTGTARMPDGSMIIGGGRDGPHGRGGTAESRVNLPQDTSGLALEISMWHGTPGQMGHGIHGKVKGGKVVVLVNEVPMHTIVCRHRHMFGDWWPEPAPELGRTLPPVDLKERGIKGRSVEIKIQVDPHTCMNLKSIDIKPIVR